MIDSHCHLDYPPLYENLDKVIDRAKNEGIKYLLTISTTLNSFDKIKTILSKYSNFEIVSKSVSSFFSLITNGCPD